MHHFVHENKTLNLIRSSEETNQKLQGSSRTIAKYRRKRPLPPQESRRRDETSCSCPSVSFASTFEEFPTLSLYDYTEEEVAASWYDDEEFAAIESHCFNNLLISDLCLYKT